MYAIEENVTLKATAGMDNSQLRETMMQLEVGQSFVVPPEDIGEGARYKSLITAQTSANAAALRLRPKRFATRKTSENGVRVWRTANVDVGGVE